MSTKAKHILIIYYNPDSLENTRITILHHLKALENTSRNNNIHYYNAKDIYQNFMIRGEREAGPGPKIRQNWDAIILHYSFLGIRTIGFPFRKLKKDFSWIGKLKGLKIAIPQDEGDYAGILDEWLFELGTDVILSVHYASDRPLYPIMRQRAAIYQCLPGYIDENTVKEYDKKIVPISERNFEIVYRARHLPKWFGRAGMLKYRIADVVKSKAIEKGYNVDISTKQEDSMPGPQWLDFVASGKTVLGAQGGYSTIDWRGELKAQVKEIIKKQPDIDYKQLCELMPPGWDHHRLFTITPRHFEAVITNTCQILIRGDFKGILIPDIHYIPLNSDWSNLDEALERIQNTEELQRLADQARKDILYSGKYSYKVFANLIERAMDEHHYSKKKPANLVCETELTEKILDTLERQFIAQRNEISVLEDRIKNILTEKYFEAGFRSVFNKGLDKYRIIMLKWMLQLFGFFTVLILIIAILYKIFNN